MTSKCIENRIKLNTHTRIDDQTNYYNFLQTFKNSLHKLAVGAVADINGITQP